MQDFYVTTTRSNFDIGPLPPSPWWRWFDVFREAVEPVARVAMNRAAERWHRWQERYPLIERKRRKRRAFLNRLRTL